MSGACALPVARPALRRPALLGIAALVLTGLAALPASAHSAHSGTTSYEPGHPATALGCDPLGGSLTRADNCLLPYPNDWWTKTDRKSATGRRLDLPVTAMPRNAAGKPIEPADYNRSDGFSAGSQILTDVPGMTSNADLAPSGLPPVTNIGAYANPDAGVVVIDTVTGLRVPVWAELDQYAQGSDQTGTPYAHVLMVHPAQNLTDGRRYVVGLRHLQLDDGTLATPTGTFSAYVNKTAKDPRAPHMEDVLTTLETAGVARSNLYLAWDFTTASTANVTGRLISIRDDAFKQLGDTTPGDGIVQGNAPAFAITGSTDLTAAQDNRIARVVTGTFDVPCYLAPSCVAATDAQRSGVLDYVTTPAQFALDPTRPDAVPTQTPGQTYRGLFQCNIPRQAFIDSTPMARPSLYGHGLFGGIGEVNAGNVKDMAAGHDMVECATDWYGMATGDVPTALLDLQDLSRFPTLVDKVEQGELAFTYLARLMVHADGMCSQSAFQRDDHSCLFDRSHAYYDGNSQGGIYGGVVCAIIPDVQQCVLGVSGMNYSVLLPRSSDFVATHTLAQTDPTTVSPSSPQSSVGYSEVYDTAYPDQSQRILTLTLLQTLWDRGDPNGFASHMTTDPLPGSPAHHVLMQIAYGDHQVANVTAEAEASTIGAHVLTPELEPGRSTDVVPYWGIPAITSTPYNGSGLVLFDSGPLRGTQGTNSPPAADVPNRSGADPHGGPRATTCGQQQKSDFLTPSGVVTDPCPGPKFDQGYTGGL